MAGDETSASSAALSLATRGSTAAAGAAGFGGAGAGRLRVRQRRQGHDHQPADERHPRLSHRPASWCGGFYSGARRAADRAGADRGR